MLPGWYTMDSVAINAGKIVFNHDRLVEANQSLIHARQNSNPVVVDGAMPERILVWPRKNSLSIKARRADIIDLRKPKSIQIIIEAGNNEIQTGSLSVRAASAGLSLGTAGPQAFISQPRQSSTRDDDGPICGDSLELDTHPARPDEISFGNISRDSTLEMLLPYDLERNLSDIKIKLSVKYRTAAEEFSFVTYSTVNLVLPVSVNVQEIFKKPALFAKFTIGPIAAAPLQLHRCHIQTDNMYEFESMNPVASPATVFQAEPYSVICAFKCKERPSNEAATVPMSARKSPTLLVEYQSWDQEVLDRIQEEVMYLLRESSIQAYSTLLASFALDSTRRRLGSGHDMETAILLEEYPKGSFEDFGWRDLLSGLPPGDARTVEALLRSWHAVSRMTCSVGTPC